MAKTQYRITTVCWLDGKPTTMVFSNAEKALETYTHLVRGKSVRPHFATFGLRKRTEHGGEVFKMLHAHMSADVVGADAFPKLADLT